jgi:DNA-binding NarL/FixJ family response regulator
METMKKILIVDDHAIIREGLKRIIESAVNLVVAGEAANGQEALNKVRDNDYDLVILDISMPGRDGLDTLMEMKKMKPLLPVLILSSHPEEQYALRAYRAGASGYLTKMSPNAEIIVALQKLVMGKKYINPEFAECIISGLAKPGQEKPHNDLSNREYQVLCLIASGKPVGRIAEELALSVKTVSTFRANILRKMSMANNAELTRYAIENKLV